MTLGTILARLAESRMSMEQIKELAVVDDTGRPFSSILVDGETLVFSDLPVSEDDRPAFPVVIQDE